VTRSRRVDLVTNPRRADSVAIASATLAANDSGICGAPNVASRSRTSAVVVEVRFAVGFSDRRPEYAVCTSQVPLALAIELSQDNTPEVKSEPRRGGDDVERLTRG